MPTVEPLKEPTAHSAQSSTEILAKLPIRAMCLGPSASGKTVLLTRLIVDPQFYGGKFSRVYWFSPSASVDEGLDPLREYVKRLQPQDTDASFYDEFDPSVIQKILDRAKKVTQHLKATKQKKRFNVLIVIDDFADNPQAVHKCGGILETLYVKARHYFVSTIISSQKLKLISPCIRVNLTALFIFRLRNQSDLLDGVIREYSALIDAKTLMQMYRRAVSRPFGFLFIDLLSRDLNHMFYNSFLSRFVVEEDDAEEVKSDG